MKQGDQEKIVTSPVQNIIPPFDSGGREQLIQEDGVMQFPNEDQFGADENVHGQDQIILPEYAKNQNHDQHQNIVNQALNLLQDSQQQEAVPQFSTNPDQPPETGPQIFQNQQIFNNQPQVKTLVTQFGRQLGSYGGDDNDSKRMNAIDSNTEAIMPMKKGNLKITTQNTLFNSNKHNLQFQSMGPSPGLSQQRTINLNFFDDLQVGLEIENDKINYELELDKADEWFQDPNFSVIIRNPKGSEFIDQDIEDEDNKMYESRELGTPLIIDTSNRERNIIVKDQKSNGHKAPIHSESLGDRVKKQGYGSEKKRAKLSKDITVENQDEIQSKEVLSDQNDDFVSALDMGTLIYKTKGTKSSMVTNNDYNTANQESEVDQFIPRVTLINRLRVDDQSLQRPQRKGSKFSQDGSKGKIKAGGEFLNSNLKYNGTLNSKREVSRLNSRNVSYVLPVLDKNDESDIVQRFGQDFEEIPQLDDKRARMKIVNKLQEHAAQSNAQDNSFFMIVEKAPIERIEDIDGRCAKLLRLTCRLRINLSSTAKYIITSKMFEAISLMVIVANSVSLAIEDPTSTETPFYQEVMDNLFLTLYSLEMVLKILGCGFIFNKGAYLRDAWNILDFVIVMTGYIQLVLQGQSFNLSGLRSFRVLRPLRSIQRIEGLKLIVTALLNSLHLLRDTVIVLLFFFFIFAIAGLQLFTGVLKRRCINEETGIPHADDDFCGYKDCVPGYFCGKRNENPNFDQTNFDTILYAILAIFTSVTLEGWTSIMNMVDKSYTNISFIFFIPLVFIGAFFLLNLTLAVIQTKYKQEHEKKKEEKQTQKKKKKGEVLDFDNLEEEDKKKLIEKQLVTRSQVLKKWKLILLIKSRMRNHVRKFKRKKNKKENKLNARLALQEKPPTIFGISDYGSIFAADNQNQSNDQNNTINPGDNNEIKLENDSPPTSRQLISSQNSMPTQNSQIQLVQLDDKTKTITAQKTQRLTGFSNFRQLNQEAIAEEDDEYKTEFSNIMGNGGLMHLSSGGIGKGIRRGSAGSKGTPASPSAQDQMLLSIRRSSSKQATPFHHGLTFTKNEPGEERILDFKNSNKDLEVSLDNDTHLLEEPHRITSQSSNKYPPQTIQQLTSPDKRVNMIGMIGLQRKSQKSQNAQQKVMHTDFPIDTQKRKKSIIVNQEFFKDFINQDLDILEQRFSEDQLMDLAVQLDDPQNVQNNSNILDPFYDRDNYSDKSILSDEYNPRKTNMQPQNSNNNNNDNGTHQSDLNDDRNNTPYTATTGNKFMRQRSKNTQHNFLSQDLSISVDVSSELQQIQTNNDEDEAHTRQEYEQLRGSPKTFRDHSFNDGGGGTKSNELPTTRQMADLKPFENEAQLSKAKTQMQVEEDDKGTYKKKMPKPLLVNRRHESPYQNTSATMVSTINQNGTVYSETNPLIKGFSTMANNDAKPGRSRTKITPIGAGSYFRDEDTPKARHGPNTIFCADYIAVEKSVLNSRFLASDHIGKHEKVYLRKDKFDFVSSPDIFEERELNEKKRQLEENRRKATEYQRNWMIQPYQRKQIITQKIFKPDEDMIEQLAILEMDPSELEKLIQQRYDKPYISILHVTGTLSICIQERINKETHRTRKIQDREIKSFNEDLNELNVSVGPFASPSVSSQNLYSSQFQKDNSESPMKKHKSTVVNHTKLMDSQQQFRQTTSNKLFLKNQQNPIVSRTIKRLRTAGSMGLMETKNKNKSGKDEDAISNAKKKEALLNKQAAKDVNLQRKLILTGMTLDAYRSNKFRALVMKRKNRLTPEETLDRRIMEIFDLYKEDDGDDDDEEEEDEESDDENAIKDDFIDWPIDFPAEIMKAKKKAAFQKKTNYLWSGQDVLCDFDPQQAKQACYMLSEIRIWPQQGLGAWKITQVFIKNIIRSSAFDNFLTLCVFINTVCLALDRHDIDPVESENLALLNTIFTWIFIVEMSMKIIGLTPVKYLKDRMNYLDGIVVILSVVEMSILSGSKTGALSAFRSVRIFRIFRVLRVARLLRQLQSMQVIIGVLVRSMSSFIYLFLLLMLFLFIYSLLGMQIFGGSLSFDENFTGPGGVPRTNFDNFNSAFLTAFQIVTMESWPYLLYDALRSDVSKPVSILYFISWVFLGNFMLLNLFLAILLDSFTVDAHNKVEEDPEKLRQMHFDELAKKEGEELIMYYQEIKEQGDSKKGAKGSFGKKKKKKKTKQDENMLDESFEYDKDLLTKKQQVIKKRKADFEGVDCERSFYIFKKSNPFRIYLYRTCTHTAFEGVILTLIILSSIKLVIDTYLFDIEEDNILKIISDDFDKFFTVVFALESVVKTISFGVIQDKGSYLRDTWSQLDFFIVITSCIDATFENINIPIIKILRLLRTLRPLRFISHNSGMKTIVMALIQSVGGIVNVAIVVMIVWMMFAILAVNLFGGKLQYCTIDTYLMTTKEECLKNRGQWKIQDYNFDSVPTAMITLFALATLENWPDTMYNVINAQGEDIGPAFNANPANGYFFVVYILIGSFLFLNLFVGVIFKEFEDAQKEEKASLMLKDNQEKWVDMMRMIVNATPDLETTNVPKQKWRAMVHGFVTGFGRPSNYFDMVIMSCIVLNMLQMAINFEGSSAQYNLALDYINYFFTSVFALECVLKLIGFGSSYFKTSWNIFDFCVVCSSLFDIIMNQLSSTSLKFLRVGPQLARVLRVLRVSRLFRLINKYKGLQALIQTIQFSLPSLFNVFSLLMLVYFIFAVLGTFLFRDVKEGIIISDYSNFSNFGQSMLILIRMSTGEDWNYIMFDTMRTEEDDCIPKKTCGISYAPIFFIPYMMLSTFIMLNLFILVIIQQFDTYYLDENNVINQFKEDLEKFKKTWTAFTKDHNCLKIKDTRLVSFFSNLEGNLGMKGKNQNSIIKHIMGMDLISDNEGFVYFNELLFKGMRQVYGEQHVKNKILVMHELNAMRKLETIKQKMIKKSRVQERLQAGQVNPFMLQMYMNASFKAWNKLFQKNQDKRKEEIDIGLDKYALQSDDDEEYYKATGKRRVRDEDWEYLTEEDLEISDNEYNKLVQGDEYEEDSDDEDEIDSSRMLNKKPNGNLINISTLRVKGYQQQISHSNSQNSQNSRQSKQKLTNESAVRKVEIPAQSSRSLKQGSQSQPSSAMRISTDQVRPYQHLEESKQHQTD